MQVEEPEPEQGHCAFVGRPTNDQQRDEKPEEQVVANHMVVGLERVTPRDDREPVEIGRRRRGHGEQAFAGRELGDGTRHHPPGEDVGGEVHVSLT